MNQQNQEPQNDGELSAIIDDVFGTGVSSFTLPSGLSVQVYQAKVRQISEVVRMFGALVNAIPKDEFDTFLRKLSERQKELVAQGKSPFELGQGAELMLLDILQGHSLLMEIFTALSDTLPRFISIFTSASHAEIGDLVLDEFAVVVSAVVSNNYGFFTRSLRPLIARALASWKNNKSDSKANPPRK